jgi:pimeloyl-ACP methyl ester carboxylesterase
VVRLLRSRTSDTDHKLSLGGGTGAFHWRSPVKSALVRLVQMDRRAPMWLHLPWGRMRVHIFGSGPPILALHGLGGSGRYWEELAQTLQGECTVVAPDLAGFGASDKPAIRYDRGFHLDTLDAVFRLIGLKPPHMVVGHSMGGILGALWAARRAGGVRTLALVASPYPASRVQRREWEARGVKPLLRRAVQFAWPVLTLPYRSGLYPRGVIRDYARHTPTSYWRTAYDLLWDPAVVDELQSLQSVTQRQLLLYARDDRQVPLLAQDRWGRLLPGAQREVVDQGGHQLLLATHFEPLAQWIRAQIGVGRA